MYSPLLFLFHWAENLAQGCALAIVLPPKWGVKSVLLYATLGMAAPISYVMMGGQIWQADWVRSAVSIAAWFVILCFVFEGTALKKLTAYLFLFTLIFLAESSTALFFVSSGMEETILRSAISGNLDAYIQMQPVFLLFQIIYCILVALLWKKCQGKIDLAGTRMFLFFLVTQALLLFLLYFISLKSMPPYFAGVVLAAGVLCAAADTGVYQAAAALSRKAALEQENEACERQLTMQLAHYEAFSEYSDRLCNLRHDLGNLLQALSVLISGGDKEAAKSLAEELESQIRSMQRISPCENTMINALIFVKQKEMEDRDIRFTAGLRASDSIPVEKMDICRVFGNLLDNAIEACEKILDPGLRWISLKCGTASDYFIICCENSCDGQILLGRDGLPKSRKSGEGHGRGLYSLREIADRYEGQLSWNTGDGGRSFQVVISLRIPPHVGRSEKCLQNKKPLST